MTQVPVSTGLTSRPRAAVFPLHLPKGQGLPAAGLDEEQQGARLGPWERRVVTGFWAGPGFARGWLLAQARAARGCYSAALAKRPCGGRLKMAFQPLPSLPPGAVLFSVRQAQPRVPFPFGCDAAWSACIRHGAGQRPRSSWPQGGPGSAHRDSPRGATPRPSKIRWAGPPGATEA